MQFRNIPTNEIYAGDQARKNFDERYLNELADSMREVGVLQPILVRHAPRGYDKAKWLIVAGERRWRAAQIAEVAQMPCVVTDVGANDAAVMSHAENFQRRDLTAEEEASVVQELMSQGLTNVQVANELNKSAGWVNNRVQYLKVGPDVRDVGARVPKKMSALIWADKVKNQNIRRSLLRRIEIEEMPFSKVKSLVEDYLKNKAISDAAHANAIAQSKAPDSHTETRRNAFERGEVSSVSRGLRVTGGGAQWTPNDATGRETAPDWKSAPTVSIMETVAPSIEPPIEPLPYSAEEIGENNNASINENHAHNNGIGLTGEREIVEFKTEAPPAISSEQLAAQRAADLEARRVAREAQKEADAKVLEAIVVLENYVALCSADAHAKAVLLAREITRGTLARR